MALQNNKLTHYTFFHFLAKLFKFIAFNFFYIEKEVIFELDLTQNCKPVKATIPLEFKWGTEKDILLMDKKKYEYARKGKRYVLERMKKGDELMLVLYGNKIAGYHLVMKGAMELAAAKILDLPLTKAYLYKGFVEKSFRGKRIIDHFIYLTAEGLKKRGFKKLIMAVSRNNFPMLKVIERMAFNPIGSITLVKILGYTMPFVSRKTLFALKSNA